MSSSARISAVIAAAGNSSRMNLKGGGSKQFIEIGGNQNIVVSGIKIVEDGSGDMIIRLYETVGKDSRTVLKFTKKPSGADYADINETPLGDGTPAVSGNAVTAELLPYAISTLRVKF